MPAALLIGGTGFVGRHLAARLSDRYAVTTTGSAVDIRDARAVASVIAQVQPDIVVDLASITTVRESVEQPRAAFDISLVGLLNIGQALQDQVFQGRLLYVSSSEVYGPPDAAALPLTEASPLRPRNPYSVAKVAAEALCHQMSYTAPFEVVVARPFTHIGPGQSSRFAVSNLSAQIAEVMAGRREPVLRAGNLGSTRDLTDVRDVVAAYDLLLHRGSTGGIYNVCSGREVVMREVVEELIALSGLVIELAATEEPRPGDNQRVLGSFEKLRRDFGWKPVIPLRQTLIDTLAESVREHSARATVTGQ